jgi:hypothetical protein
MIGNKDHPIRPKNDIFIVKNQPMAYSQVIIEAPERTEYILVVPVRTPSQKPHLMNGWLLACCFASERL